MHWLASGLPLSNDLAPIVMGGVLFFVFGRFRIVDIDADALVVSDFRHKERVPLSWIETVEEHRGSKSVYVSVTFDRESGFGRRIVFWPDDDATSLVEELRSWGKLAREQCVVASP